jgi:ABC-type Zn uptake system ZnuABC Zn-binding protein ZnuA
MTGSIPRAALLAAGVMSLAAEAPAQDRLRIVATLPTYAAIAREVVGDRADVASIARGDEDPHFVQPRPSFAALMQRADLFITTGLDLELWVPALLDRANNPKIRDGQPGQAIAYTGVRLLEIPEHLSRTGGDIHIYGNPHIHTDPINAIIIARNILDGLRRVDAPHVATYEANLKTFEDRILRRLFGDRLVEILGGATLFELANEGRFWDFAERQRFQGTPLTEYLGGWLAQAEPFRNQKMVCYHKNWAYFSARFRVACAMFVEPKPGIPPSPGHVGEVIAFCRRESIRAIFTPNFYSKSQVDRIATRTGAAAVLVPLHEGGEAGMDDYFSLVDTWVTRLAAAFRSRPAHPEDGPPPSHTGH